MQESGRARRIAVSYMREGMSSGEAIRAAAKLMKELDKRKAALAALRIARTDCAQKRTETTATN